MTISIKVGTVTLRLNHKKVCSIGDRESCYTFKICPIVNTSIQLYLKIYSRRKALNEKKNKPVEEKLSPAALDQPIRKVF